MLFDANGEPIGTEGEIETPPRHRFGCFVVPPDARVTFRHIRGESSDDFAVIARGDRPDHRGGENRT